MLSQGELLALFCSQASNYGNPGKAAAKLLTEDELRIQILTDETFLNRLGEKGRKAIYDQLDEGYSIVDHAQKMVGSVAEYPDCVGYIGKNLAKYSAGNHLLAGDGSKDSLAVTIISLAPEAASDIVVGLVTTKIGRKMLTNSFFVAIDGITTETTFKALVRSPTGKVFLRSAEGQQFMDLAETHGNATAAIKEFRTPDYDSRISRAIDGAIGGRA